MRQTITSRCTKNLFRIFRQHQFSWQQFPSAFARGEQGYRRHIQLLLSGEAGRPPCGTLLSDPIPLSTASRLPGCFPHACLDLMPNRRKEFCRWAR
jgi:hypothetical protein